MFADRLTEMTKDDGLLIKLMEGSRKVVIHTDVVSAASDLLKTASEKKMREISKYTCWPDFDTWMEFGFSGADFGVYFHGDNRSVVSGHALIIIDWKNGDEIAYIPISVNLENYHMQFCDLHHVARIRAERMGVDMVTREMFNLIEPSVTVASDPLLHQAQMIPFMNVVKPLLLSLLAFMNSPKLIRTREVDLGRLNARRLKRGKYPYHPHHEVRLNIDKHDIKITQGQGDGPERCLHFVRAHMRFLVHPRYKNVSVVLVPPHYRGNPELGIMNTSYAVDRKNSKWKN